MQQDELQKKRNSYLLRLFVGALVLYYAYSLYRNLSDATGTKWYVLIVFAVLFAAAGAVMILNGGIGLLKYANAAPSAQELQEEAQDEALDGRKEEASDGVQGRREEETLGGVQDKREEEALGGGTEKAEHPQTDDAR